MIEYSNQEKLKSLSKSSLSNKDIAVLMNCGKVFACKHKKTFKDYCETEKIKILGIPTDLFCKVMGIDQKRIIKFAKLGY